MNGDLANWMVPGAMVEGIGGRHGPRQRCGRGYRGDGSRDHVRRSETAWPAAIFRSPGRSVISRVITDLAVLNVADAGSI